MSLTTPYLESYLTANGVDITFGFSFDAISENYVRCLVYMPDGAVITPNFTVDLAAGEVSIVSMTTPDGELLQVPPEGATVRIYREAPESQDATASVLQAFTSKQLEKSLDKIVATVQQVDYKATHKTVRTTETERDVWLDKLTAEHNDELLKWDESGHKITTSGLTEQEIRNTTAQATTTATEAKTIATEAKGAAADAYELARTANLKATSVSSVANAANATAEAAQTKAAAAESTANAALDAVVDKQDIIPDLETIRAGAAKGATAVQPAAISDMETKTNAAATYQPKGDYATKTELTTGLAAKADTTTTDTLRNDVDGLGDQVHEIEAKVPAAATTDNQLADKAFVNSSINAVAAYYITSTPEGDSFATKADLVNGPYYFQGAVRVPTTNDYALVKADETHEGSAARYMYDGKQWDYQYTLNDTPFTQAQVDAINSGITAGLVSKYNTAADMVDVLDGEVGTLKTEMTAAQSDIGALKTASNTQAGLISGLQDDKADKTALPQNQTGTAGQVYTKTDTGAEWQDASGGSSLPDQTGNAGKFLTTDGTNASWSDKPLVNNATGARTISIGGTGTGGYSLCVGEASSARAFGSTALGFGCSASALYAIQLGNAGTAVINSDANTFKVANGNGNFEMMSADGTIPSARLAADGTTGQVLAKTDTGMEWKSISAGGSSADNNGLEGDYCSKYGIVDETSSGLPTQGTGNQIIIPAQLVMDVPGSPGLTTNSTKITHDLVSTTDCEIFLSEGTVIEATDVFFQTDEPQNGATGYAAWWNGTEWKFKSNDTGNVWRPANAVRIAKCVFTGGSLTRLSFTGCRVLNKQLYATKADLTTKADTATVNTELAKKQDKLVSGTNIKTVNGESLLGSGNIQIDAGGAMPVGAIFTTPRTGTIAGAVEANGGEYNIADYSGVGSIGALLTEGKIAYVSKAEFQTRVANTGACDSFGWDGATDTTFLVPKLNPWHIGKSASVVGNGVTLGLTDGTNNTGLANVSGTGLSSRINAYGSAAGTQNSGNSLDTFVSWGITTDPTKSGMITDLSETTNLRVMVQLATGATDQALETCTSVLSDVSAVKNASNFTATGKMNIIRFGIPDYAAGVTVTPPFTAPNAGVVAGYWYGNGNTAYINGSLVGATPSSNNVGSLQIPVDSGDVLTLASGASSVNLYFYPFKGAQ